MKFGREVSGQTQKEAENGAILFGGETVHLLSCGLLHIYKPVVTRVKQQLNELT